MQWLRVRFTVRQMMVVVAIIALALATIVWVISEIDKSLYDFYGPGGVLQQMNKKARESVGPTQGQGRTGATSRLPTPPDVVPVDDK